ncbi:MAG: ABC transporter ATP-binding protein, partial [Clostridia bacterium]|nr:ABC transporter ATP-binding protein [Clostridia bacterium]
GIVLEKELDEAKLGIHRVQAVFDSEIGEGMFSELNVIKIQRQGKLLSMTIKGDADEVESKLKALNPIYMEMLPLTLEEVFISEMEVVGYDIDNILK